MFHRKINANEWQRVALLLSELTTIINDEVDIDENEDEEKANRSQVSMVLELSLRSSHTSYKCSN